MSNARETADAIESLIAFANKSNDYGYDYSLDTKGVDLCEDISEQPILDIPEGCKIKKHVLSTGIAGENTPVITIQEENGPVCYRLPDYYAGWCREIINFKVIYNANLIPSDVQFSKKDGEYSAVLV